MESFACSHCGQKLSKTNIEKAMQDSLTEEPAESFRFYCPTYDALLETCQGYTKKDEERMAHWSLL